jgi:hypothetical protein
MGPIHGLDDREDRLAEGESKHGIPMGTVNCDICGREIGDEDLFHVCFRQKCGLTWEDGFDVILEVPYTFHAHAGCFEKYGAHGNSLPAIPRIQAKIKAVLEKLKEMDIEV